MGRTGSAIGVWWVTFIPRVNIRRQNFISIAHFSSRLLDRSIASTQYLKKMSNISTMQVAWMMRSGFVVPDFHDNLLAGSYRLMLRHTVLVPYVHSKLSTTEKQVYTIP